MEKEDVPIDALTWRLSATAPVPNVALNFSGQRIDEGDVRKGTRRVYFSETGYVSCTVYDRYALRRGTALRGPAVIEERESTAVIGPGARINVDRDLNLLVDIDGEESA